MTQHDPATPARATWMGVLAKAAPRQLEAACADLDMPGFTVLRSPEIGAVMVRGRTGGTGAPFNLGEMTVTRCTVKLDCGTVGHGYVQGRDKAHAERAAICDALLQTDRADAVHAAVIAPLSDQARAARATIARKAAATKVDFFTMVRGED